MPAQRARKAGRILDVQIKLKRVAEARLAETVRTRARLEAEEQALVNTLGDERFGALLLQGVSRRLEQVGAARAQATRAEAADEARVRQETLAMKRAERFAETAGQAARAHAERAATDEIAQASALRAETDADGASLA